MLPTSHKSFTTAARQVRATERKSHFQTFGRSERMYYGDGRHDDAWRPKQRPIRFIWYVRGDVVTRIA